MLIKIGSLSNLVPCSVATVNEPYVTGAMWIRPWLRHALVAPAKRQDDKGRVPVQRSGPLKGKKIIEFVGVGPGPFCGMLLADMGAEVVSIDRTSPHGLGIKKEARFNPTTRNRVSIAIDLKSEAGRNIALQLVGGADAIIEGNRPGVMERLRLGPEDLWAVNRRLIYGRVTGWGQDGPMAQAVGHDLNYLAVSGILSLLGPRDGKPSIPLNLLADYAGGGLYLALGILAAIIETQQSGVGQVVDAAMIDGLGSLMTHHAGFMASGRWVLARESNFLDGGAPWYNVYETKDGQFVAVAPIESKFYVTFVRTLGLDPAALPDQMDRDSWPALRDRFAAIFKTRTRTEWCSAFDGLEACFAPVLSLPEAASHPHIQARSGYIDVDGVVQPAPAPRFSRTPAVVAASPVDPGENTEAILRGLGLSTTQIAALRDQGAVA